MESRFGLGEVTPVGVPRQEQVVAVGRVCCESAEGKINRASILLEVRIHKFTHTAVALYGGVWSGVEYGAVRCIVGLVILRSVPLREDQDPSLAQAGTCPADNPPSIVLLSY